MSKKIFLAILSLFLIWYSYNVVTKVSTTEISSLPLLIFIAWVINMLITGVFAFSGFAFPTQKLLPASYYQIHNPKKLKKAFKFFRVDVFRKALLATLWRSQKQREQFFNGKMSGIATLEEQSMKSEFGHLLPFVIICVLALYFVLIGLVKLGLFTLLFNFLGNFYPIILQRQHRMRVAILKRRMLGKKVTRN